MATDPTPATQEAQPPKKLWDTVLTGTPVLLAILATVLASRSSSEMVQAQYHRSVAAQNQAQSTGQWDFFQARKQRVAIQGVMVKQMQALGNAVNLTPKELGDYAAALPRELKRLSASTQAVLDAAGKAKGDAAESYRSPQARAEALHQAVAGSTARLEESIKTMTDTLKEERFAAALKLIDTGKLPLAEGEAAEDPRKALQAPLAAINPRIPEVIDAIEAGVSEKEIGDKIQGKGGKPITVEQIREAEKAAKEREKGFDRATNPATDALAKLDGQLGEQRRLLRPVNDAAFELRAVVRDLPAGESTPLKRLADDAVAQADSLERLTTRVGNDFLRAQADFERRRNDRESRYNQVVAGIYEIQVRKSNLESEGHILRSQFFLYAMLAAQAGVTIATFGLAVRQKSILWALATAAGVTAVSIGVCAWVMI